MVLLVCVALVVVLRSTLLPAWPGLVRNWDVLLPFIAYFGQRRSLGEGVLLTMASSHLYSLCSAAPIGVYATHYLVLFFLARLISYAVFATAWFSTFLSIGILALVGRFTLTAVANSFGHGWPLFTWANLSPFAILWNTLAGFAGFHLLVLVDRATYKTARANIELIEQA